jgi:hypothetical protein
MCSSGRHAFWQNEPIEAARRELKNASADSVRRAPRSCGEVGTDFAEPGPRRGVSGRARAILERCGEAAHPASILAPVPIRHGSELPLEHSP